MPGKAVRFEKNGGSDVLTVQEVPVTRPGPGQVLVRVHAAGLNPIETMIRAGYVPIPPPVILGTDGAGVVEEVGCGVHHFKKGDRVAIFAKHPSQTGTYAEFFLAEEDMLFHLPHNLNFHEGAALGIPFMTAYYNLVVLSGAKSGDVVLINGASGAVGLFGIEIARHLGCKVIGVAGNDDGLAQIAKKGAVAISYKDSNFIKKIQDAAGPNGVDIILETQAKNIPHDIDILAKFGRVNLIGTPGKESLDFGQILGKELTIKGTQAFSASPEQYKLMKAGLDKALKEGAIHPVIQKVYSLDQVSQAHDDLVSGRGAAGKLVLDLA